LRTDLRIRGRKGVRLRERIRREEPLCRACLAAGRVSATTEIDHIVPLAKGGTNDRENLRGLCKDCHRAVTSDTFGRKQRIDASGWPVED
jgi:5-methylcytosine-specific restriction protein A